MVRFGSAPYGPNALAVCTLVVGLAPPARGQVSPPPPTLQASSLIAGAVPSQMMDSGTIPAAGGTQALVNDSFSGPIQFGGVAVGSATVQVNASVSEGTIKLFSTTSDTANQASVAVATTLEARAVDSVQVTQLPGGQGQLSAEYFPSTLSASGTITGGGHAWFGQVMLTVTLQDIAPDGSVRGSYVLAGNYTNGNTGTMAHDTAPIPIPVQLHDTLTLNADEILQTSAGAILGVAANVTADFSHTTHLYLVPLTPGLAFSSASGDSYLPIPGDANVDGKVDFSDLVALARNYGQSNATWAQGDFDADGKVDFADLVLLARNYGATADGSQFAVQDTGFRAGLERSSGQVPEPTSAVVAGAGAATLLCKRRRLPFGAGPMQSGIVTV